MRVFKLVSQMMVCGLMVLGLTSSTFAALELRMQSVEVDGPGPLTVDVNIFIDWDGNGTNLISSINFDVVLPAEVTLPDASVAGGTLPDPMGFGNLSSISFNSVAFTRLDGNVAPLSAVVGSNLLTTLRFNVNAAYGVFAVDLQIVEAGQGGAFAFNDITSEVTVVTDGTISVVPEPSALALIGLASVGFGFRRNRRMAV